MKKIILSLLVAGVMTTNAQDLGFAKKNIALTGSLGYNSTDNGAAISTKTSTFGIMPSIQYFIQDNISLNAGLGFQSNTTSTGGTNTFEGTSFGFGVGANYYFMKGQFSPFLGLGITYDMGTQKTPPSTIETKVNTLGINLMPGINYFLAKNWAINATVGRLGFNSVSTTVGSAASVSSSDFGLNVNLASVGFGVSYVFK